MGKQNNVQKLFKKQCHTHDESKSGCESIFYRGCLLNNNPLKYNAMKWALRVYLNLFKLCVFLFENLQIPYSLWFQFLINGEKKRFYAVLFKYVYVIREYFLFFISKLISLLAYQTS